MNFAHKRTTLFLSILLPLWGLFALLIVPSAAAANVIQNGDFADGLSSWWTNGDITNDTSTGALCITINTDSANPWETQLGQSGVMLEDGVTYTVSFMAKASPARDISFKTGDSGPAYANYVYQTVPITTAWSSVSITYTQVGDDSAAQFEYHLGTQGTGEVCLDDIVIDGGTGEPAAPTNMIVNGDFMTDTASWEVNLNETGAATVDAATGAGCLDITEGGTAGFHVQFQQANLNLLAGATYEVMFDLSADPPRNITYKTGQTVAPYGDYVIDTIGALTTTQTITNSYVQSADDPNGIFQFQLGNEGAGSVCVDNISLVMTAAPEPIDMGEGVLIANGDFADGMMPWQLQLGGTGAATADTANSEMCVDITDAAENQWDIVLNQAGISVKAETDYSIMFDVKAEADRELFFKTGNTSFENYTYQSAQATADWSTVSVTYTQAVSDTNALFEFHLGARGTGQICLDNVMMVEVVPPLDRDIARNGQFENSASSWTIYTQGGSSLIPTVLNDEMELDVTAIGENPNVYDAMLWQLNLPVVEGYQYSFQFDARADIADGETRDIFAKVGQNPAPYATYGGGDVTLTNEMQTYTIDFTMMNPSDLCGKIEFHLAQTAGKVYVDNVRLLTNAPTDVTISTIDYMSQTGSEFTLRELAEQNGILIGAATDTGTFNCNGLHNDVFTTEFNSFTPSNAMKMGPLVPIRGEYNWTDADAMVDFAEANDMNFHGHALVWHFQMAGWADRYDISRTDMLDIMYEHIDTVVDRYKGRIAVWDVVNEAIEDETFGLRQSPWQQNIGDDYINLAFERASAADPTAELIYNDYNNSLLGHPKADAVYEMIRTMVLTDNVPIDGVGMQMHWELDGAPDKEAVAANMARYHELGIEVYITEIDVRIPYTMTNDPAIDELALQATVYQEMLEVCIEAPNCNHYTTWGISDVDSWIPGFFAGYDDAHLFDDDFNAKPAFDALVETLSAEATAVTVGTASSAADSAVWLWLFPVILVTIVAGRRRATA